MCIIVTTYYTPSFFLEKSSEKRTKMNICIFPSMITMMIRWKKRILMLTCCIIKHVNEWSIRLKRMKFYFIFHECQDINHHPKGTFFQYFVVVKHVSHISSAESKWVISKKYKNLCHIFIEAIELTRTKEFIQNISYYSHIIPFHICIIMILI